MKLKAVILLDRMASFMTSRFEFKDKVWPVHSWYWRHLQASRGRTPELLQKIKLKIYKVVLQSSMSYESTFLSPLFWAHVFEPLFWHHAFIVVCSVEWHFRGALLQLTLYPYSVISLPCWYLSLPALFFHITALQIFITAITVLSPNCLQYFHKNFFLLRCFSVTNFPRKWVLVSWLYSGPLFLDSLCFLL